MWYSASFVANELAAQGNESLVQIAIDANSIDALVTAYDPDFVFIEGLWVTPAKFTELLSITRHAPRRWVVRIHSEIPFLQGEGVAMEWISQYLVQGITVAPNAQRALQQIGYLAEKLGVPDGVAYLPNCYPTTFDALSGLDTGAKTVLDVGCFGAFRPFKNHLQQVFIAAKFADKLGLPLRFHTNMRTDGGGASAARNVAAALESLGAEHVMHDWEDRETFLQSLRDIDLLTQLSISETFNIVAADTVLVGRPVLASAEISWVYPLYGDPHNVDQSLKTLDFIWGNKPFFIQQNRLRLKAVAGSASSIWRAFV
jgi:hypothetical protein